MIQDLFDTAEILPSHRTRCLSFAFWLEPYISDCRGAELVPELWESLRFPQSAGSDTTIIVHQLKPLEYIKIMCQNCQPINPVRNSSAAPPLCGTCGTSFGGMVKFS